MLLPMCAFVLISTCSTSTVISTVYVIYGHESTLPLERTVCAVTDGLVKSVSDCIENIKSTL